MDRFNEMQVFVRIAERNSFTLAAEDLFIPRATVTNLIKRLESRLNTRLLERTTRQVNLTDDGRVFYERCVSLLSDLEEIEHSFSQASPKGILRVNLQGTLAKHFIMPSINQFLQQYPDITLHMAEDDRQIDLVKEGVDCVLRAGQLLDSTLIAKPVARMPQVTVASPEYLDRYGYPESLSSLKNHQAVGYSLDVKSRPTSLDFRQNKKVITFDLPTSIVVAGAELYTSAALAGLGLIQVPRYRIESQLALGKLVEILKKTPPPPMPVAVLYPQNKHLSLRVRVFVRWVSEQFEKQRQN